MCARAEHHCRVSVNINQDVETNVMLHVKNKHIPECWTKKREPQGRIPPHDMMSGRYHRARPLPFSSLGTHCLKTRCHARWTGCNHLAVFRHFGGGDVTHRSFNRGHALGSAHNGNKQTQRHYRPACERLCSSSRLECGHLFHSHKVRGCN